MAQKVEVSLVDDLDGTEAAETVSFSLDGIAYEIDLGTAHAFALRKGLEPYAAAARKGAPSRRRGGRDRSPASKERSAEIRALAKANGLTVSERGRIPAHIIGKYERGELVPPPPPPPPAPAAKRGRPARRPQAASLAAVR